MNQYHYLAKTALFLALIASVSSFNIVPLRAGTIQITDNDLRQSKLISKQIDLQLTKEFYQSHKDIQVIASFSSLTMDDKLNFYFDYNIQCPTQNCFLNFTVLRKTEKVNSEFTYSFDVDYLVARGLYILQLNMTSYQEHLNLRYIKSYNEKNQKIDLGKFVPRNNEDAMRIMAIPNGFSNLTRTGRVVYLYTMSEDMYVVHYMEHDNGHGEHDAMGWPEGVDHIKYKVLFLDASYHPEGCRYEDKWNLTLSYTSKCGTNDKTKWFFGFKSTKQREIKGYFTQNYIGYSFHLDAQKARYGTVAFPIPNSPDFIDQRLTKYTGSSIFRTLSSNYIKVIQLLVIVISLIIALKVYKRRRNSINKMERQTFDRVEERSETFPSERDPNQQIENIPAPKNVTIS